MSLSTMHDLQWRESDLDDGDSDEWDGEGWRPWLGQDVGPSAEELKAQGNEQFKAKEYGAAQKLYTKVLKKVAGVGGDIAAAVAAGAAPLPCSQPVLALSTDSILRTRAAFHEVQRFCCRRRGRAVGGAEPRGVLAGAGAVRRGGGGLHDGAGGRAGEPEGTLPARAVSGHRTLASAALLARKITTCI